MRYISTIPFDDAKREASIALLKAIRNYDPTRAAFSTFATKIIVRQLSAVAKQWQRWNKIESIDAMRDIPELRNQIEKALGFDDRGGENILCVDLLSALKNNLSEREYDALTRRIHNQSLRDLAEKYQVSKERIQQVQKEAKEKARLGVIS